jgi:hypothetical protein
MEGASSTIEVAVTIDNSRRQVRSGARCTLEFDPSLARTPAPLPTRNTSKPVQP